MVREPKKTIQAGKEFIKSYQKKFKSKEYKRNLPAHEEANRKGTEESDAETAAAFSALREQLNPDGSWHVGDTRTREETDETMDEKKTGRENAKNG